MAKRMKTYSIKADEIHKDWFVADAENKALGRLASKVAQILKGKHKPTYTPHMDMGDFVVVVNADKVKVDPYGPASQEYLTGDEFAHMWTSALAHCQKRFEGKIDVFDKEPSGGLGCFTADSFPVFDRFCENVYIIADSNHGYKMIGVGKLVAEEILENKETKLLKPFRFNRYAKGELHPTSHSPFPWS